MSSPDEAPAPKKPELLADKLVVKKSRQSSSRDLTTSYNRGNKAKSVRRASLAVVEQSNNNQAESTTGKERFKSSHSQHRHVRTRTTSEQVPSSSGEFNDHDNNKTSSQTDFVGAGDSSNSLLLLGNNSGNGKHFWLVGDLEQGNSTRNSNSSHESTPNHLRFGGKIKGSPQIEANNQQLLLEQLASLSVRPLAKNSPSTLTSQPRRLASRHSQPAVVKPPHQFLGKGNQTSRSLSLSSEGVPDLNNNYIIMTENSSSKEQLKSPSQKVSTLSFTTPHGHRHMIVPTDDRCYALKSYDPTPLNDAAAVVLGLHQAAYGPLLTPSAIFANGGAGGASAKHVKFSPLSIITSNEREEFNSYKNGNKKDSPTYEIERTRRYRIAAITMSVCSQLLTCLICFSVPAFLLAYRRPQSPADRRHYQISLFFSVISIVLAGLVVCVFIYVYSNTATHEQKALLESAHGHYSINTLSL